MMTFERKTEKILTGKVLDVAKKINVYERLCTDELDVKYCIQPDDYKELIKPMNDTEKAQVERVIKALKLFDRRVLDPNFEFTDYITYELMYKENIGYYVTFGTNGGLHITYYRLDYYGEDYETAIKLILNKHIDLIAYIMARNDGAIAKQEYVEKFKDVIPDCEEKDDFAQRIWGFNYNYIEYYATKKMAQLYNRYYNGVLPDEIVKYLNAYANYHLPRPNNTIWGFDENLDLTIKNKQKQLKLKQK